MNNYKRVMVHDIMGTIDLSGDSPRFIMAGDRLAASGPADTLTPMVDDQAPGQSLMVGRDVFLQRQENEWRRNPDTVEDGEHDANEVDENGVSLAEQTLSGHAAVAAQNAKNKNRAKASTTPTGRDLFMQRSSQAWRNGEAA